MDLSYWGDSILKKAPVGPLGIIALQGSRELAKLVDQCIVTHRQQSAATQGEHSELAESVRDSFLIKSDCPRFSNGEGKGIINETVRGYDIYILADIGNYSCKFKMFGMDCPMSPDDHFQDIKRVIAAVGGKARRITVIMPMLYESRQHWRQARESLDCALALQELQHLGVDNIITFDAHDVRVQNAIPLSGFENLRPTYEMIRALLETEKDLLIDKERMLVVSPDEGGIARSIYYASTLKLDLNTYYKRRDYTRIVDGRNPIIKHEFLGGSVAGKDVLIVDDILASGESLLDIAKDLKRRKANRIYIAVTYALFVDGLEAYNKAHRRGLLHRLYTTNMTYRREELRRAPWFVDVDMSGLIAYLIDMMNYDHSISSLFEPAAKIGELLQSHQLEK
jgi:ribose-phosphate pyrophosphokinase